ncbi:hypothetical protein [Mycobacterium sp.]|uniref:hypothetical protein n=1 Tax=Mycobacterium sp. TaxID=1785 RepID=UPI0031DE7C9A
MTAQPIGPQSAASPNQWYGDSPVFNHFNLVAGMRAGLIALVLLAALAVVVL